MELLLDLLKQWATPAILGVVVGAGLHHLLQKRRERAHRILSTRFELYQKYLGTLESISQSMNADFHSRFMAAMPSHVAKILAAPDDSDDVLVEMARDMSDLVTRMSTALTKASNELHGLRLVSSPKLLNMVEEYMALQRQLYQDACTMIEGWRAGELSQEPPNPPPETAGRGRRAEQLLQDILQQMRKELGTDK